MASKDQMITHLLQLFGMELPGTTWTEQLGLQVLETYATDAAAACQTIVSIGSGAGTHEARLEKALGRPIICIDPAPESHAPKPKEGEMAHPPDYPTSDELAATGHDFRESAVLLIWPSPNADGGAYDRFALDLHPRQVVIVYELSGSAGSPDLHTALRSISGILPLYEDLRSWVNEPDHLPYDGPAYRLAASEIKDNASGAFRYGILRLERID